MKFSKIRLGIASRELNLEIYISKYCIYYTLKFWEFHLNFTEISHTAGLWMVDGRLSHHLLGSETVQLEFHHLH